jgi:ribose-phosphate pyrophosphokinase
MRYELKIISGSANPTLAEEVAKILKTPLTEVEIKRFNDGEIYVRVLESVRGADVYVIQPTCSDANLNLMELLIMIDALKRASPSRITAVVPYFGYARQDKKIKPREPITAKLVTKMIETAGTDRLITFDLHSPQLQGYFDIPSDNLDLFPIFAEYIKNKKLKNVVVVAPDVGATVRTRLMAKILNAPLAIIDKRRPKPGVAEVENVVGDVKGKTAIIIDDIIDTAGTIAAASSILKKFGAKDIYVFATHAVLSGPAVKRLEEAPIKEVVLTNSIPIPDEKRIPKIKIISLAGLLSETIKRCNEGLPMGIVYKEMYKKLGKGFGDLSGQ